MSFGVLRQARDVSRASRSDRCQGWGRAPAQQCEARGLAVPEGLACSVHIPAGTFHPLAAPLSPQPSFVDMGCPQMLQAGVRLRRGHRLTTGPSQRQELGVSCAQGRW